jgi:hypothetical protein
MLKKERQIKSFASKNHKSLSYPEKKEHYVTRSKTRKLSTSMASSTRKGRQAPSRTIVVLKTIYEEERQKTLILHKSLHVACVNNEGISVWKQLPFDHTCLGKTVDLTNARIDSPILEAINAVLLQRIPELASFSTVFHGVTYEYPQNNKDHNLCTTFYDYAGKHSLLDMLTQSRHNTHDRHSFAKQCLSKNFASFLYGFEEAGNRYGITHNDMHAGNLIMDANQHIFLIDYGRMHIHEDKQLMSSADLDIVKRQFLTMHPQELNKHHIKAAIRHSSYQQLSKHMNRWYSKSGNSYVYHKLDICTLCMFIYNRIYHLLSQEDALSLPIRIREIMDTNQSRQIQVTINTDYIDTSNPFPQPVLSTFNDILSDIYSGVSMFYLYLLTRGVYNRQTNTADFISLKDCGVFQGGWQFNNDGMKQMFFNIYSLNELRGGRSIPAKQTGFIIPDDTKKYHIENIRASCKNTSLKKTTRNIRESHISNISDRAKQQWKIRIEKNIEYQPDTLSLLQSIFQMPYMERVTYTYKAPM